MLDITFVLIRMKPEQNWARNILTLPILLSLLIGLIWEENSISRNQ